MTITLPEAELQQRYSEMTRVPPQQQEQQPGLQSKMKPKPDCGEETYVGSEKLVGKVAVITGGDSGIGRAVAIAFAREGADIALLYYNEHEDAQDTNRYILREGRRCQLYAGDAGDPDFCRQTVRSIADQFGRVDVVVNNAAEQHVFESLEDLPPEQVEKTFRTNIFSAFYLTSAAVPHMPEWSSVINTTSITAYRGSGHLPVYSSTKGAIVTFTRSLSSLLMERKIRVNSVAPGPVWTPLIPASFDADKLTDVGEELPIGRRAQPAEIAPAYVFLASADSSYIVGQTIHVNGGTIIGG